MANLGLLALAGNRLSEIPREFAQMNKLRVLQLHNNEINYLPREIIELRNMEELSLRGNPLVRRFVRDLTYSPPSLLELAGRVVKVGSVDFSYIPQNLQHL